MIEKLQQIVDMWEQDAKIDVLSIGDNCLNTPLLHSKYIKLLAEYKIIKTNLTKKLDHMINLKTRYFKGELSLEELKALHWKQWQYNKPLKTELEKMINADKDVIAINTEIENVETVIEVITSILNQIKNRDFQLSNYIKYKMFERGEIV